MPDSGHGLHQFSHKPLMLKGHYAVADIEHWVELLVRV